MIGMAKLKYLKRTDKRYLLQAHGQNDHKQTDENKRKAGGNQKL
jgi:hypothetical protein